ncbi:uncharacterized protein LOC126750339 [Anthonomus grandis grandis]|uniref:uncharacterized protein LOC126750339 n=1 Tax=Anthonomus grandis grandis TaxID=2921223 RepID=UPI0021653B7B|nr:uncharacterized protein LOC126750339 [Anthonomus grandis grandis]
MKSALINFAVILLMFLGVQQQVAARPNLNSRVKRVSDPHFSDLETRVALHKINGIAITLPVAAGRDLDKIGRKRRSQSRFLEALFNQSEEEQGDPRENERRLFDRTYDDLLYNYDK